MRVEGNLTIGTVQTLLVHFIRAWSELNLRVDEHPPKMTFTLRRLVRVTTVHEEQSDIPV